MPISLDPGPSSDEIIRPENLNKLKEEINDGSNNGMHARKNEKMIHFIQFLLIVYV